MAIISFSGGFCFGQQNTTNTVSFNGGTITTIISYNSNVLNNVVKTNVSSSLNSSVVSTTNQTTTVATNLLQVMGVSSNGIKIASDFANNFIQAVPYIKNEIVNADFSGLYNPSEKKYGWFSGIDIPIGTQAALGGGFLRLGNQSDLVPLSLKLSLSINYPIIGEVDNFIGTGPLYDITDDKMGTYNTLGAVKYFKISKDWNLSLGGGISDISTISGIDLNIFLRLNYHF